MKGMNLRRLFAAAQLLCMSCLVLGKDDKTTTVSTAVTQTITQQTSSILTVTAQVTAKVTETVTQQTSSILTVTAQVTQQTSSILTVTAQVTAAVTETVTTDRTLSAVQVPQPTSTQPSPQIVPPPAPASNPTTDSQGQVFVTIALQQAALANLANVLGGNEPQGIITIQPGNAVAIPQATGSSGSSGSLPTGIAESSTTGPAQGAAAPDPAQGAFPGGNPPNTSVDLPLTILFLLMYIGGAATHISIYRANAKRGHKFLLSDLMFDFCMVRTLTCIFRIIWVFSQLRGIVLAAQIFFNGGASVIFAVNIFLVQRIVRSMHPRVGWSVPFSIITRAMAISVPVLIISQIVSLIVLFFSVNDANRFNGFESFLKFGTTYLLILATFPFWAIFIACSVPGPKPEKFGVGDLRVKTSLVMLASAMLTTGSIVRTHALFNPRPADTDDVLYGKPVFYTTQFMLEIFVVAAYAAFRFDLLYHIPNGSSKPGDYSTNISGDMERSQFATREAIEERIAAWEVPHQILAPSNTHGSFKTRAEEPIYAVFYPQLQAPNATDSQETEYEAKLPPRPTRRVSRRESIMEYIQQRPRSTMRSSYYGFNDGNVPPLPTTTPAGPTSLAPQFWFDRPRKPPQPPT